MTRLASFDVVLGIRSWRDYLNMKTLVLALAIAWAQSTPAAPSDEEIRQILKERIDVQHQSVGIVVGVVDPNGSRTVSWGRLNQNDTRSLNGDTIFEIGSATKVF